MNDLVDGRINASILITGSSRALTHFDARLIEQATSLKTFNIGINGSQTDMEVAVLKTYLKHNVTPRLLIHSLDAFSFVTSHGGQATGSLYMPYLEEADIFDALSRIDPEIWKARRLPLVRYMGDMDFAWWLGLRGLIGWNPRQDRFSGFQPRHTPWTGDFDRLKELNPGGVTFEVEPDGVNVMRDLLELCRRSGIHVLFVYSPEYVEMQSLEKNREQIFQTFRTLSAQYDVPFWDYSGSAISRQTAFFYNSQHLNAAGAEAFSRDLATALRGSSALTRR
jgi:hypothetical protein